MRKPPNGGPSEVVIAEAAAQVPMARPRTSFGKMAEMIARLCGTSSAAPTPCSDPRRDQHADVGATAQSERGEGEDDDADR